MMASLSHPSPGAAVAPGYVNSPERTPYPAIVLAQPTRTYPNGAVTVIGNIWLGASLVMFECRYPDGSTRLVPVANVYDPGELDQVMLFPLQRVAAVRAPATGGVA